MNRRLGGSTAGEDGGGPILELRAATVRRGERHILDAVSLSIDEGEHTAFVGPNGSGKSSLIKLLTHEHYPLPPRDGVAPVRVFGRDRWDVFDLRPRLGIVSPDLQHRFVRGTDSGPLLGLDAVLSGFFASELLFFHHDVTVAMRERAMHALERMGAARLAGQSLATMSTGEARRVLIARALVTDPRVLVLDEPTSGLDLVARRDFLDLVGRLAREGVTLLLVTHQVEEILPEIRRVILMRDGRVAADGTKERVMTSELLGDLFGSPVVLGERDGYYSLTLDAPPPH
jgi:iron complex transport system ATP-binding protein